MQPELRTAIECSFHNISIQKSLREAPLPWGEKTCHSEPHYRLTSPGFPWQDLVRHPYCAVVWAAGAEVDAPAQLHILIASG